MPAVAGGLLAANNLSDVASAATSRTNLGVAIGTDVQAHSAILDATTESFTTAYKNAIDALDSATVLKGTWDASAGTFPGGGAAQAGYSYIVSVGGTVNSVSFSANDRIIAIIDNII